MEAESKANFKCGAKMILSNSNIQLEYKMK